MSLKFWVGICTFVGSIIGGYLPALWGGSLFSYSSVLLSGVGGILGVILGIKIGTMSEQ